MYQPRMMNKFWRIKNQEINHYILFIAVSELNIYQYIKLLHYWYESEIVRQFYFLFAQDTGSVLQRGWRSPLSSNKNTCKQNMLLLATHSSQFHWAVGQFWVCNHSILQTDGCLLPMRGTPGTGAVCYLNIIRFKTSC